MKVMKRFMVWLMVGMLILPTMSVAQDQEEFSKE